MLTYKFSSADPENQEVAYMVSWGDTSPAEWSASYASEEQVVRIHSYPDSGVYHVKVKARDAQQAESDWSDSVIVKIGFWPPDRPGKPVGPASCTTGVAYAFAATATHPVGDSVWFQFDWGGAMGVWGGPVASDSVFQEQHVFDSSGTFSITVRARDARGDTSAWSEPLYVSVVWVEPLATPGVTREAISEGAALRLSWPAVPNALSYEVTADDSIYTTVSTVFTVTALSATIEVRAVRGSRRSDPATIDCRIAETTGFAVYGISDTGASRYCAFGVNHDGTVSTYLPGPLDQPYVDFYADDVVFPGSMYLINAGDRHWNSRGNTLKYAGTAAYEEAKLADAPGTGYFAQSALEVGKVYYLWLDPTSDGWSLDDRYAKAKVVSISGTLVTMQLGCQKIQGLRWLPK
jgi:hypothetical protein